MLLFSIAPFIVIALPFFNTYLRLKFALCVEGISNKNLLELFLQNYFLNCLYLSSQRLFCSKKVLVVLKLSGIQILFVHQKSLIRTFNTCFSITQYLFRILCLSTQIQMDIVYRKSRVFKISYVHCNIQT